MIELYLARQMHIRAIKGTVEIACIERQILSKTLNALSLALGLDADQSSVDDIERRILQSSRRIYIGRGVNDSLQAAKTELAELIYALRHDPESILIRQTWVAEFHSDDKYALMVTLAHRDSECESLFEWIVRHDMEDASVSMGLNCFQDKVESGIDGSLGHQLISTTLSDSDSVGQLFDYLYELQNQGLQVKDGEWVAAEFSEYATSQLLLDILPVSLGYTKSDWAVLCQVFDENAYLAHFDEGKLTKSDALRYLAHYMSCIKEEDAIELCGTVWPSVICRSLLYFLLTHNCSNDDLVVYSQLVVSRLQGIGYSARKLQADLTSWLEELVMICDMNELPVPPVITNGHFSLYIEQAIKDGVC